MESIKDLLAWTRHVVSCHGADNSSADNLNDAKGDDRSCLYNAVVVSMLTDVILLQTSTYVKPRPEHPCAMLLNLQPLDVDVS